MQQRWERVRELQDTRCCDDACEAGEIGNSCCDDVCDGPVDGDDGDPEKSAAFAFQRRGLEKFDEDVVIEYCSRYILAMQFFFYGFCMGCLHDRDEPLIPMFPYNVAAMSALTIASELPAVCSAYDEMPKYEGVCTYCP